MLSTAQTAFVKSAVIFGDPDNGKPVGKVAAANTKVICHNGDKICDGQAIVLAPHLTYSQNAGEAAKFVASTAGAARTKRSTKQTSDGALVTDDDQEEEISLLDDGSQK